MFFDQTLSLQLQPHFFVSFITKFIKRIVHICCLQLFCLFVCLSFLNWGPFLSEPNPVRLSALLLHWNSSCPSYRRASPDLLLGSPHAGSPPPSPLLLLSPQGSCFLAPWSFNPGVPQSPVLSSSPFLAFIWSYDFSFHLYVDDC